VIFLINRDCRIARPDPGSGSGGSLAFVKAEVGVLNRGHFDIGILVKCPRSSIMAVAT
jgi:hypothetical protein